MGRAAVSWLVDKASAYLVLGCRDPDDPECRRRSAILNATSLSGRTFAVIFVGVNLMRGNAALAAALSSLVVVTSIATWVQHRTKRETYTVWVGILVTAALFLYMLASGGDRATGFIWAPLFPLFSVYCLGHRQGSLISVLYLAAVALVLFAPDWLPGAVHYPLALSGRLLGACVLAAVIAYYFERWRKEAQSKLAAEIEVRRQAERVKSELLAAVSHEVRTPLTAIMGLNNLLVDTGLNADQRRYVELALRAGRDLVGVLNDILEFSHTESGKLALEPKPFDLHELVADVVSMHEALLSDKSVTVELVWDEQMPRRVVADRKRVRQVLVNLTGNAVKFTNAGRVVVRVRNEEPGQERATATITVEDSGIGLSDAQKSTVFDAFVQTDDSKEGSGLGLAIAKNLVEAMGGEIGVRSALGEGASFWFRLPFSTAGDGAEVAEGREDMAEAGLAPAVLLVEDNDLNRDVLRVLLERAGCSVQTAANGAEAVDAHSSATYDLILMDCQMPVVDGYSATARIRAAEAGRTHRTPIVAITAHALQGDLQRCIDSGMDGWLTKPISPEDIEAAVRRWVQPNRSASIDCSSAGVNS